MSVNEQYNPPTGIEPTDNDKIYNLLRLSFARFYSTVIYLTI